MFTSNTVTSTHVDHQNARKFMMIGIVTGVVLLVAVMVVGVYNFLPSTSSASAQLSLSKSDEISGPQYDQAKTPEERATVLNSFARSQEAARLLVAASERNDLIFEAAGSKPKFAALGLRIVSTGQRVDMGYDPDHPNYSLVKSWATNAPYKSGQAFTHKLKLVLKRQSAQPDGYNGALTNWVVIQ